MSISKPSSSTAVSGSRSAGGLWVYPGLIILTLVVICLLIDHNVRSIVKVVHEITDVEGPTSAAAYEMEINVLGAELGVRKYLATGDPEHRERFEKDAGDFEHFRLRFKALVETPHEADSERRVAELFALYKRVGESSMELSDKERALSTEAARGFTEIHDLISGTIRPGVDPATAGGIAFIQLTGDFAADLAGTGAWMGRYRWNADPQSREQTLARLAEARAHLGELRALELVRAEREWAGQLAVIGERTLGQIEQVLALDDATRESQKRFIELRNALDDLLGSTDAS